MKTKKVLLINSPFPIEQRYGKGLSKIASLFTPMGLLYLAGSLEKAGYQVEILDAQLVELSDEKIVEKCRQSNPDLIGMNIFTANFNRAIALAEKLKKELGKPIVLGGPHATISPKDAIENSAVDFAIIGEGDKTIVELCDCLNE